MNNEDFEWHYREIETAVEKERAIIKRLRAALKDAADTLEANGFACGQARAALANEQDNS